MRTFLFFLFVSGSVFAQGKLLKSCKVRTEPVANAMVICEQKEGTHLDKVAEAKNGFMEIETKDCFGFVEASCVSATNIKRRVASVTEPGKMELALSGLYGGTFSRYYTDSTSGSEYGCGIEALYSLTQNFRIMVTPELHWMTLTRTVDASGSITDSNPAEYSQVIKTLGVKALVGYSIVEHQIDSFPAEAGLGLGVEYLLPQAATQTTNFNTSDNFKSTDRWFFAVLSLYSRFHLSSRLFAGLVGEANYNLGSAPGTGLYTARLNIELGFDLN